MLYRLVRIVEALVTRAPGVGEPGVAQFVGFGGEAANGSRRGACKS